MVSLDRVIHTVAVHPFLEKKKRQFISMYIYMLYMYPLSLLIMRLFLFHNSFPDPYNNFIVHILRVHACIHLSFIASPQAAS